jgi:lysophosphatidate acyltransferase
MSFIGCLIKPLAYVSVPLYLIRKIANQPTPSPLRYYARLFVYVSTLVTVASCSFFVAAGMSIVGRSNEVNYVVARIFYGIAHRALDLKVEVEGEEFIETRPAVYMANHQSMIDILILGR